MTKYKVILHSDAESDIESSFKMGFSSVGRTKCETVGAGTTAGYYKTTHIIAIGLSSRAGERTIGCFHSAFDCRTLSRPLHG